MAGGGKSRLGKGLGALLPDLAPRDGEQVKLVAIDQITPNRYQPRAHFDRAKLEELASSISEHGIIQPLLVREHNGKYELVAGERRWRAARLSGLHEVPVVVRKFDDVQMQEVALIENLQREDLNPIEEAQAYRNLMDHLRITQDELAKRVGKSRSAIANTMRLLQLDTDLQEFVKQGQLNEGHARALLPLPKSLQKKLATQIVHQGLTVRQAEKLAQKAVRANAPGNGKPQGRPAEVDPFVEEVRQQLQSALGTPVRVHHREGKGVVEIEYFGLDDLDRLLDVMIGQKRQRA